MVTQGEYLTLVGNNPSHDNGVTGGIDYGLDLTRPVETVSWDDATNYCALRTQQERAAGLIPDKCVYRLPTESEWEYAARAGTTTAFYVGNQLLPGQASFNNLRTTPVGSYAPNPWGLYDMSGNLWEWCQDWWGPYPTGSVIDPKGVVTADFRVIRGGGYYLDAEGCRSAVRNGDVEYYTRVTTGFRVVLAPAEP